MTQVSDTIHMRVIHPRRDRGSLKNATHKVPVIGDVARLAGVSVPTVSRVLTGAARVSADKRERVQQAIEELDYRPSSTARALVLGSKIVAVIAGNTTKYGYASTIQGVEEAARVAGYVVMIMALEESDLESTKRELDLVLTQPLAGVIVLQFDQVGADALKVLPQRFPTVAVAGAYDGTYPHASLDEVTGAVAATNLLLDLGHQTVHHVSVPHSVEEQGRTTGWRDALTARGIEPPPIQAATWEPSSGRIVGRQLAFDDNVTAVFCGNDEIAMGVIRGLNDAGKVVPDDVSVVGFDDHPLASMWIPALTTVSQDFVGLGAHAFALLMDRLEHSSATSHATDPTHLIVRESATSPKASG